QNATIVGFEDERATRFADQSVGARAVWVPSRTESRWRAKQIALAVAGLVALSAMALAPVLLRSKKSEPPGPLAALKTIAVLPSKPSGVEDRDPASEFGLAASLINRLSGIRSLVVRPAAAIVKYASVEQDPIDAGREQQVNYVLASSYQKS